MDNLEKECLQELDFIEDDLKDFNKLDLFNAFYQRKIGNPDYDYLTLNGYRELTDYSKSIKDVDYEDYLFQKEHLTEVRPTYDTLYLPEIYFRAIYFPHEFSKSKEFFYGSLISAREYGLNFVFDKLLKKIDKKYPFIYKRKPLEKTDEGFYSMDFEVKAAGKEVERKELINLLYSLRKDIENDVIDAIKPFSSFTFIRYPKDKHIDGNKLFIIGGFVAAENIFYQSFFNDFFEKEQHIDVLNNSLKTVYKKYKNKLL